MMKSYNISKTQETNGDGIVLQNLALFIILLSFFIVLNSISTFEEEKIKPVMQSIEATFAHRVIKNERAPSTSTHENQSTGNGTVYDHLDDLFQSQFKKKSNTHRDDKKGLFYTQIPYKKLQTALSDIRPHHLKEIQETGSFLPLLKSLLLKKNKELRLDIVLQTEDDPLSLSSAQQKTLVQKISALGQKLTQAGFPNSQMSVGLGTGKEMMVLLVIRPHTPYAPYKEGELE